MSDGSATERSEEVADDSPVAPVCTVDELSSAGKLVVDHGGRSVVIFWNSGEPGAMDNECIHRQRALAQGVLLNGRVVCPGHQWAFELGTGWCWEREKTQPTYRVVLRDGTVHLSLTPTHS